jgi:hypothetical protein
MLKFLRVGLDFLRQKPFHAIQNERFLAIVDVTLFVHVLHSVNPLI